MPADPQRSSPARDEAEVARLRSAAPLPDRYEVLRHIANGGMGGVWEARDEVLGRTVAVKVLAAHLAEDPNSVERFQREARAAASVSSHPHVATVYDIGENDGRPFIVMEHFSGGTVADRLRSDRPVEVSEALAWLGAAASALDVAHEEGIVHRDVKPANLLLDDRGKLAMGDFGIARLAYDQTVTATGQVLGTAAYISPEQASGDSATPASDRYALGVVAYELLCCRRPFGGEHFAAQARQHIEAEPPAPTALNSRLPPAVDPILRRALAKDPQERWPTATAFVDALTEALGAEAETEPTVALRSTTRTRALPGVAPRPAAAAAAPAAEPAVPAPQAAPPGRRRPRWSGRQLAIAALALVALVAVVGALASAGGDGGGEQNASAGEAARERAARRERRQQREEATAAGTQQPQQGAQDQPPSAASGDTAALNDQGYQLMQAGNHAGAVPVLQKAVDGCGSDPSQLPCAYAMYNLGRSLRLAGRPAEAIPILEKRLQNPDQRDTVQTELDKARNAAAQAPAGGNGGEAAAPPANPGKGNGKAKGKGKKGEGSGDGD